MVFARFLSPVQRSLNHLLYEVCRFVGVPRVLLVKGTRVYIVCFIGSRVAVNDICTLYVSCAKIVKSFAVRSL